MVSLGAVGAFASGLGGCFGSVALKSALAAPRFLILKTAYKAPRSAFAAATAVLEIVEGASSASIASRRPVLRFSRALARFLLPRNATRTPDLNLLRKNI